jgi:hypothetical protein
MFFKRFFSRSNLEFRANDGGRLAAGFKGKAGDCVVRSIAIATGISYQKIYQDLYEVNKKFRINSKTKLAKSLRKKNDSPRTGTHRTVLKKYLEHLGWKWNEVCLWILVYSISEHTKIFKIINEQSEVQSQLL